MPMLLIATALQAATASCAGGLCDAERLRPFLTRLRQARDADRPVRILQIGDSHTAGDQITGSWRTLLQARFGGGGRGVLPPGRPYAGYLTRGITAAQSDGWRVNGIFGAAYAGAGAPAIGISGYSLTSTRAGATISLTADPAQAFDRFTVCALTGRGAGQLTLIAGPQRIDWSLDAPVAGSDCRRIETPGTTTSAAVIATGNPVTITSWATERARGGGVVLSNLGTVGAQLIHTARADDRVVARELAEYRPDLIVIAFGTNEAFRPSFSAAGFDADLSAQLRRWRRLAGADVPMLVLGAPDSATRLPALQRGEAGDSAACAGDPAWRQTAALAVVQDIQRRRAHQYGVAYWDWGERMGGRCTTIEWTRGAAPAMRGDHVHFTKSGGAAIAALIQQDIDAALRPARP